MNERPVAEFARRVAAIGHAIVSAAELIPDVLARPDPTLTKPESEWTVDEVTKAYGVGRSWIYDRMNEARLRSHKRGKYRRFIPHEVAADMAVLDHALVGSAAPTLDGVPGHQRRRHSQVDDEAK